MVVMFRCSDDPLTEVRRNPVTLDVLLLCDQHAELHDDGIGFRVYLIDEKDSDERSY